MSKFTEFVDIINQTDLDIEARRYSGRGMYGNECVGIVVDDVVETIIEIVRSAYANNNYLHFWLDELKDYRTDDMGLQMILYFPRIKWEGSVNEDESDLS